jgi:hypothetical protein
MRTQLITILVGALALTTTVACKAKEGGDTSGKDPAATKTTEVAPAKTTWKKLGALGIEAEVAEDANIDDNTSGAGYPAATLWTSPTMFVSGGGDASDLKPTMEETKTQLGKDPNKLKAFTKEEKTADGWILELTRDEMAQPGHELLAVSVRRTINGKPWDCGSNVSTKAELEAVKKVCQSLRAAK